MSGTYGMRRRWEIAIREDPDVPATVQHLGLLLSTYFGDNGQLAFPSRATLAECAKRSEDTVDKAISWLKAHQYLRVTRGGGRQVVNRYELALPSEAETRVDRVLGPGKGRTRAGVSSPKQPQTKAETAARRAQETAAPEGQEHCSSNAERIARANACAFCGATASSTGWTFNRLGDRLCGHHHSSDPKYLTWSTRRAQERTEEERLVLATKEAE